MTEQELEALAELHKEVAEAPDIMSVKEIDTWCDKSDTLTASMPALIAAARGLNKACEDREKAEKWWSDLHGICVTQRNELASENARLRAVVEAARAVPDRWTFHDQQHAHSWHDWADVVPATSTTSEIKSRLRRAPGGPSGMNDSMNESK